MGKYMRKGKLSGEVAVMEVSHQTPLGVRTRARTLALQRQQSPSSSPDSSLFYLELRSRRLEKLPPPAAKAKEGCKESSVARPTSPKAISRTRTSNSDSGGSASTRRCSKSAAEVEEWPEIDEGIEVSFGENVLDVEERDRNARETTPCSLIRDSETIGTPGSTTRPNSTATNRRVQSSIRRNIPTSHEMEEFFAAAEQLQQRIFMEKYNFDPVNESPLPGRYEWVKLDY
ncbi:cyclin-dependent kinase inhibitor 4-like [Typha angustifolia]|uniref:cyclin-dependent kinase inhibitor 4-like n=1 Tax=Typha angustifolia TaxID=59011 RepID=UPI003C2D439D